MESKKDNLRESKKEQNIIGKVAVLFSLIFMFVIIYNLFDKTITNIYALSVNPFLDKELPVINFFKFIWYLFFISGAGFFCNIIISLFILTLRVTICRDFIIEDWDISEPHTKVFISILDNHFIKAFKFAWFSGLLFLVALIFFGHNLSLLKGFYIWVISYALLVTIYILINVIIDSTLVKIHMKDILKNDSN